jgi:hypothetical protein
MRLHMEAWKILHGLSTETQILLLKFRDIDLQHKNLAYRKCVIFCAQNKVVMPILITAEVPSTRKSPIIWTVVQVPSQKNPRIGSHMGCIGRDLVRILTNINSALY